jgi:hypothetical protein
VADTSFQIGDVTPGLGADLSSADTTFTIEFTSAVVKNTYTTVADSADQNSNDTGTRQLQDDITLTPVSAKDATVSNTIPVHLDWADGRTDLEISPAKSLQDGYIYRFDLGSAGSNEGIYDTRFRGQGGGQLVSNADYPADDLEFSVGLDESQPAVPDVTFNPESAAAADANTLEDDVYNVLDNTITAPLQVNGVDNSGAQVKGYEVYYRSQNQAGRSGTGDTFVKATGAQLGADEASSGQFEDYEGIIPASDVFDGEFDDGDLEFTVEIDDSPFSASDGAYGPVEWKFRAVSINGVRSDFTSVITTPDNEDVDLIDSQITETDGDGDITELVVAFSEPLQTSTVDAGDFTIEENGTNTVADVDISVSDDGGGDRAGDILVLDITENTANTDDIDGFDDLNVSGVEDLAGNGLDDSEVNVD